MEPKTKEDPFSTARPPSLPPSPPRTSSILSTAADATTTASSTGGGATTTTTTVVSSSSSSTSSSSAVEVCRTPSYGKSLLAGIEDLFKQRSLCDFTIRVSANNDVEVDVPMEATNSTSSNLDENRSSSTSSSSSPFPSSIREFPVHKIVMASCSDYFRALFSVNMVESRQDGVDLHVVSASGLAPLIDYAYTGVLSLCLDTNVKDILGVAFFLQMTSAIDLIVEFLRRKMNFDNADAILEMADDYAIQKLKDHYKLLILENFFAFAETTSFLKLTATQLKVILENDSLKTSTESRLLKCAIRWYNHDPKARERDIHSVFERVRVTIDGWPTIEYAAGLDVFKKRDDCRQLVEFWVTYMTEAERRHLKQGPGTRVRSDRQSFVLIGGECYQDVFGNFHWSHPLSNEVVGNSENRYYHKDRKNWFHLGCVGYMDPISHFQFINVNDFGIFCGGYHYKYVDEIEDEDDGGNFDVPRLRRATNEARLFTPGPFGIWELSSMRESRAEFALLNLPSAAAPTHLLAVGGVNEAGVLRNAERYSIQDNRWEPSSPLPLALHGIAGATFAEAAWVCGGRNGSKVVDNLFRFDVKRKKWSEKSRMTTSRMRHALVPWKGLLYAIGGERDQNEVLSSVEIYDPELDQWSAGEPMVFGLTQHSATVLDDRLFVLGGQNTAGELVSLIQRFDPNDGPKGTWKVLDEHLPKGLKNFGVIVCTMKMPKEGEEDDKDSVHQAYDARFPDSDEESFPGDGWETVESDSDHSLDTLEWNV